jgi:hypothetical protein
MGIFGNFWNSSEKHAVDSEKRRKNRSREGKKNPPSHEAMEGRQKEQNNAGCLIVGTVFAVANDEEVAQVNPHSIL